MANIKKYDYRKICEERGLVYIKEKNPHIYVKDGFGFEHKMTRTNLAKGSSLSIRSLLDENLKNEYFLKVMSTRHPDVFEKSSFEKFNYEKALGYTTATCHKHGDYRTKPNWLLTRGHHCEKCKNEGTGERFSISTEEFIKRAKRYHGDRYDYSKTVYRTAKEPVTITCRIHGDFEIIANYHSGDTCGCQKCGMENGGYSRSDYVNSCPDGSYVYVMRIFSDDEDFKHYVRAQYLCKEPNGRFVCWNVKYSNDWNYCRKINTERNEAITTAKELITKFDIKQDEIY